MATCMKSGQWLPCGWGIDVARTEGRRQLHRRSPRYVRAPVRAVADDDVEFCARRHHASFLRRRSGRLRVRRRVNPSRGGATARLLRVCRGMRGDSNEPGRSALVQGVVSRPRSAGHNRRRGSLRAATSCPALAGLLRRPPCPRGARSRARRRECSRSWWCRKGPRRRPEGLQFTLFTRGLMWTTDEHS